MANTAVRAGFIAGCLVAGGLVWGSTPAGAVPEPPCPAPTLTPAPNPQDPGVVIDPPVPAPVASSTFDMDGDGAADTLATAPNGDVTISRGDGVVTLTDFPPLASFATTRAADLDGDGGDDLWGSFRTQGQAGVPQGVVVLSSTEPGTHLLADVALIWSGRVAGDANGDGRNDARFEIPIGPTVSLTTDHRSFVGTVDDPADGPPRFRDGIDRYAGRPDLDRDGRADQVFLLTDLGDGSITSAVAFSSSGRTVPLPGPGPSTPTWFTLTAVRRGAQTHLLASTGNPDQRGAFRIGSACARPGIQQAAVVPLGRPGSDDDLGSVSPTSDPSAATRASAVGKLLRSRAGRAHQVEIAYRQIVERYPDAGGLAYWTDALVAGRKQWSQLESALWASGDRYQRWGGTNTAWVEGMYVANLGRVPDAGGRSYWLQQVATYGRERAAARFLATPTVLANVVREWYAIVLERPADPGGLAHGVEVLGTKGRDALVIELLSSDEFYLDAQHPDPPA